MFYTLDEEILWNQAVTSAYGLGATRLEAAGVSAFLYRCSRPLGRTTLVTAAYLGEGGVCGRPSDEAVFQSAIDAILTKERARHALFKTRFPLLDTSHSRVHVDADYRSYELDLSGGPPALWKSALDSKTRNQTRKGLKSGVKIQFGKKELLVDFYAVISTVWRDLGTPSHSFSFFDKIADALGPRLEIAVGYLAGEPVTAALLVGSGETLHDPFAGTLKSANSLCVNNVLYWSLIERGCERGFRRFDLGRSRIGQGTCRFKESWGAKPVPLFYTYFLASGSPAPRPVSSQFQLATRVWRHLPLVLSRLTGPILIRHIL